MLETGIIASNLELRQLRITRALKYSKRIQKLDDGLLLGTFKFFKLLCDVGGLAAVTVNRVEKRQRSPVMHQSRTQANSPQRRGANLVSAALKVLLRQISGHLLEDSASIVLRRGLEDAVTCAYVVH